MVLSTVNIIHFGIMQYTLHFFKILDFRFEVIQGQRHRTVRLASLQKSPTVDAEGVQFVGFEGGEVGRGDSRLSG